jgi:competence protein ComEC
MLRNINFLFSIIFFLSLTFLSLFKIYFIDVGQSNSSFIVTPNNYTMLIDVGDLDEFHDYGNDMYSFIKKQLGSNKIDVVLISHLHEVHIGRMIYVLANMKVEKFYDLGFPYPSSTLF